MASVNTNVGAMVALQNLNKTNSQLQTVQNRINTGLAVSSAKDNGGIYAIAQNMNALKDRGIGTQVHYIPVHTQPYYMRRYGEQNLPGAQAHYARTLSLPLFTRMEAGGVERVCAVLAEVLGAKPG